MMVEGGAIEVSEDDILDALNVAQAGIRELISLQEEMLCRGRADEDAMEEERCERCARLSRR